MKNIVLEDRGHFWWAEEEVPDGHYAPEKSAVGTLRIDDEGRIEVELDALIDQTAETFAQLLFPEGEQSQRTMRGLLKIGNRHVLLQGVLATGGPISTRGVSYSRFVALLCLVGQSKFQSVAEGLLVRQVSVLLDGYESWIGNGTVNIQRDGNEFIARHLKEPDYQYELQAGRLTFKSDLRAPQVDSDLRHDLSIKAEYRLIWTPSEPLSWEDALSHFGYLQDFLIILTGEESRLVNPDFALGSQSSQYRAYFSSPRRESSPVSWTDCWTNFSSLKSRLGQYFDVWLRKREQYGPGFYLYLGTRRGMSLFVEHRFVNLIWGLESLHRGKVAVVDQPTKLQEKIQRIIDQVELQKDKKWLEKRLQNAGEPSLAERLAALMEELPLELDLSSVREFCQRCADRRNDISHFGGRRHADSPYTEFAQELDRLSDVIEFLYHALLLKEVGLPDDVLQWNFYKAPRSHGRRHRLQEVGLRFTGLMPR